MAQQYHSICSIDKYRFAITSEDGFITDISLYRGTEPDMDGGTPLLSQVVQEIREYLNGQRRTFSVPIAPKGTDFQQRVWKAMRAIPYGKTVTYGDLAKQIGCNGGARAVGMACNRNPILFIQPCHRVIGANGKLTGFACGLDMKEHLLELERK